MKIDFRVSEHRLLYHKRIFQLHSTIVMKSIMKGEAYEQKNRFYRLR